MNKFTKAMNQAMDKDAVKEIIENAPVGKTIALLAIPALIGSIFAQLNFILDSFFIGRIDYANVDVLLAAVAVAFPITLLITAFANLFGIGGSLYGAKALGQGNKKKARSIFSGTLIASIIFDIFLIIVFLSILNPLLTFLGANSPEILAAARTYAIVNIIGAPIITLTFVFIFFVRGEGKAKLALFAIVGQIILNIILNYIFVLVLDLGILGAALATVLSQFGQILITGYWLFSKRSSFQFTFRFLEKFNFKDLGNVLNLGIPATLTIGLITVTSFALQYKAGNYNDVELVAAIGVMVKLFTVFTLIIQATISGIQSVFSYSYGSRNRERFVSISKVYFIVSTIVSVIIGIILIIFPNTFANFLSLSGETAELVRIGTYGIAIMIIFMSGSFLLQILFQSLEKALIANSIVIIRQVIVFIIFIFVLDSYFGKAGLINVQQFSVALGSFLTLVIFYKPLINTINKKFQTNK